MILSKLQMRISSLEQVVHFIESKIPIPLHAADRDQRLMFRYANPNINHFVFLHIGRMVSTLNAIILLVKFGFIQEVITLSRTVFEFCSKIDYVVNGKYDPKIKSDIDGYIASYFSDIRRSPKDTFPDASPRQKQINKANASHLAKYDSIIGNNDIAKSLHLQFSAFGYYVHGRYPELMDMFGGEGTRIHVKGMAGTPKDTENIITLDTVITSSEISVANAILKLGFIHYQDTPKEVLIWFRNIADP